MTERNNGHAPVVTLTVGPGENGRTLKLQLNEKWGRGKRAHVHVERLGTGEQDTRLPTERAQKPSQTLKNPRRNQIRFQRFTALQGDLHV